MGFPLCTTMRDFVRINRALPTPARLPAHTLLPTRTFNPPRLAFCRKVAKRRAHTLHRSAEPSFLPACLPSCLPACLLSFPLMHTGIPLLRGSRLGGLAGPSDVNLENLLCAHLHVDLRGSMRRETRLEGKSQGRLLRKYIRLARRCLPNGESKRLK